MTMAATTLGNALPLTGSVRYDSPELACLHEAGHAVAAYLVGARIDEMELYVRSPRSNGRTDIFRISEQNRWIALGGFAVERRLWMNGRLQLPDGSPVGEAEMIQRSLGNADVDRISYFGGNLCGPDGSWPEEKDIEFMSDAQRLGYRFDLAVVESLGAMLRDEIVLEGSRIMPIVGKHPTLDTINNTSTYQRGISLKFVNKLQETRYIIMGMNSYHALLSGDSWTATFIDKPSVQISPTTAITERCWTVSIDVNKVVDVDH